MMKNTFIIIAVLLITGLMVTGAKDADGENTLNITVQMSDGSTLSGTTELTRVKFVADYGKMEISMKFVQTVIFSDDHETVKITMLNGDTLQGALDLPEFKMKSLIGTVKVPLAHLKKLTVKAGAAN